VVNVVHMVESRNVYTVFFFWTMKERDILEDLFADGKRMLKLILSRWKGVVLTFMAQDKDHWPSFVDTALHLRGL
jgi:hypothetical protein